MFKKTTFFSLICLFATGILASSTTVLGQAISAPDVMQEQAWKLGNGESVNGMLALSSSGSVTILATTKQYKISRNDLTDEQKKMVDLLDQEIDDLRESIAPAYIKMANNPDPTAIRQFQAQRIAASKFTPELSMIEELLKVGMIHQIQLGLGPIIRSGKRQYFALNDKLYLSSRTEAIRGADGIVNGIQLEFYPSGAIHELRYLDHDVTTFNWTFHEDGAIKSFTSFQKSLEEGVMLHFHSNGEMLTLATMAKGFMDGPMHLFDDQENQVATYRYVRGSRVETSPMINDKEKISRLFSLFVDLKANVFRETWDMNLKKK